MPRITLDPADHEKLGKLIFEAWTEPRTRLQLVNDPIATMTAAGIDVSEAKIGKVRIVVLEDTLITRHLIIPEDPRVLTGDTHELQNILTQDPGYHTTLGQGLASGCK